MSPSPHSLAARVSTGSHLLSYSVWHAVHKPVAVAAAWAALVFMLDRYGLMPFVSSGASSLVGILSMVSSLGPRSPASPAAQLTTTLR